MIKWIRYWLEYYCRKSTAQNMAMNAGREKRTKAMKPPMKDDVAYMEIAVRSWVEVGPGRDWHIVRS